MKLPQLQNLVKRDPSAYHEEFTQQLRAFQAEAKVGKGLHACTRAMSVCCQVRVAVSFVCRGGGVYEGRVGSLCSSSGPSRRRPRWVWQANTRVSVCLLVHVTARGSIDRRVTPHPSARHDTIGLDQAQKS